MTDDSSSKVLDLSKWLPDYETIELPSGRSIDLAAYLTERTLGVISEIQDAEEAFDSVLQSVIKEDEFPVSELASEDRHVIALKLATSADAEKSFSEHFSKDTSVAGSFVQAIKESKVYLTRKKQMQRLIATFERERTAALRLAETYAPPTHHFQQFGIPPSVDRFMSASMKMAEQLAAENRRRELQIKSLYGMTQTWFEQYDRDVKSAQLHQQAIERQLGLVEPMRLQMQGLHSLAEQSLGLQRGLTDFLGSMPKVERPEKGFLAGLDNFVARSSAQIQATNNYFSALEYIGVNTVLPQEAHAKSDLIEQWSELRSTSEIIFVQENADLVDVTSESVDDLQLTPDDLNEFDALRLRLKQLLSPIDFWDALRLFATAVQREHWPLFWNKDGGFNRNPESIARSQLGLFLTGHAAGIAFTAQELTAGAGFVDQVVFFFGQYYILELKVVGEGWSIGDAESGLQQLDSYADKYPDADTFLVLFDGRKTSKGRQLDDEYKRKDGRIIRTVTTRIYQEPPTGQRK